MVLACRMLPVRLMGALIERAVRDTDVSDLAVRVQCLDYTAELPHQTANLAAPPHGADRTLILRQPFEEGRRALNGQ